jgi:hypothetical protein
MIRAIMIKRLADWFEKLSVAALAVGLFQADQTSKNLIIVSGGFIAASLFLSWWLGRK